LARPRRWTYSPETSLLPVVFVGVFLFGKSSRIPVKESPILLLISKLSLTPGKGIVSFMPLMASLQNLTAAQLRRAIAIKEQIAALETEFALIGEDRAEVKTTRRKNKMSRAGRAAIAAAARARWARVRGGTFEAAPKRRRKMGRATRARMAAAARARWAKAKAAGKNRL
jgi:hypothetical protein